MYKTLTNNPYLPLLIHQQYVGLTLPHFAEHDKLRLLQQAFLLTAS